MIRCALTFAFALAVVATAAIAVAMRTGIESLSIRPLRATPICDLAPDGRATVRVPAGALLAEVDTFSDEILAYLRYEYLLSHRRPGIDDVFLTVQPRSTPPVYSLWIAATNNLPAAFDLILQLAAEGRTSSTRLVPTGPAELARKRAQTAVFRAAYHMPVHRALEQLDSPQRLAATQRYIQFKAAVDGRVRSGTQTRLTSGDAEQFGADIVAIADFYELPLDFFLGIGAVENNYLDVRGDLEHAVWKRRLDPGDIVLRRARGRYLVANFSTGPWQITRETLRHAHRLFLKDTRDYSQLPSHLRPPRSLDLEAIDAPLLTAYAGILFRDLLDYFGGEVALAVGAYNGGVARPNDRYQQSVLSAAAHARRVIEQAAALNGRRAADISFFTSVRSRERPASSLTR